MENEFFDIGSVKALLADARERIKEAERRGIQRSDDSEKRLTTRLDELDDNFTKLNTRMIEWLPLITNLSKAEDGKRSLHLAVIVAFITNIAAWILTLFIYFIKSGVQIK